VATEPQLYWADRVPTIRSGSERPSGRRSSRVGSTRLGLRIWVVVALVLAVAVLLPLTQGISLSPPQVNKATAITATLNVGASTTLLTRGFFGVDGATSPPQAFVKNPALGGYLNSTPIGFIRYSAGEDECNITTDTSWSAGLLGGVATPNGCAYDIAAFAAWCDSTTPHCESDIGLAGENNNSAEDGYYAQYIVDTLGFQPTYWSIGNEPFGWTHYGIPWKDWKITDDSVPTGVGYAVDVRNAIAAVRAVDPGAQFIGIQSYWCPDTYYTVPVAMIDGNSIGAVACHLYPNAGTPTPTAAQYFSTLIGPQNISSNYYALQQNLQGLCTNCSSLPIQISELQGGPPNTPAPQDRQFYGAVWLAASLVQALNAGISSVQVYDLQGGVGCGYCMLNGTDVPDPQGLLFSDVLSNLMDGHPVFNVSVSSGDGNLWATMIHNYPANSTQVLFVNANVSHPETFALSTRYFTSGQPGSIISWNSSTGTPKTANYAALPSRVTVPAIGLVLITVEPKAGTTKLHGWLPVPNNPRSVVQGTSAPAAPVTHSGSTPTSAVGGLALLAVVPWGRCVSVQRLRHWARDGTKDATRTPGDQHGR
jgi:hypothetical protein